MTKRSLWIPRAKVVDPLPIEYALFSMWQTKMKLKMQKRSEEKKDISKVVARGTVARGHGAGLSGHSALSTFGRHFALFQTIPSARFQLVWLPHNLISTWADNRRTCWGEDGEARQRWAFCQCEWSMGNGRVLPLPVTSLKSLLTEVNW